MDFLQDMSEEAVRDADLPLPVHLRRPLSTIRYDGLQNCVEISEASDIKTWKGGICSSIERCSSRCLAEWCF